MFDWNETLEKDGLELFPNAIEEVDLPEYRSKLDDVLQQYSTAQASKGLEHLTNGAIHHLPVFDRDFLRLLEISSINDAIRGWFGGNFLVNSFGGVVNSPGSASYVHEIHRDTRYYCADHRLFINLLVALDDFTLENGATLLLPKQHAKSTKPNTDDFEHYANPILISAGDALLFDSNLWHRAGVNLSSGIRRCVTITFSRPWIKPQFQYAVLCAGNPEACTPDLLQLLGYNARTPSSIEEWLKPASERFYKSGQDL